MENMEKDTNIEKELEILERIAKVLSGDCFAENESDLEEWLSESEGNRNLYEPSVHTTLIEGKVVVEGPGVRQRVLQPNEQFVLDKKNRQAGGENC